MEHSAVLVDTCLLIDFFRTKDKAATWYSQLVRSECKIVLSSVVIFELFAGADVNNRVFWQTLLKGIVRVPFDEQVAIAAADIVRDLRKKSVSFQPADIFIAATALAHKIPLATINKKDFKDVDGIQLISR